MIAYSSRVSPISSLRIITKGIIFFGFLFLAVFVTDPLSLLLLVGVCLVLARIAGLGLRTLLATFFPILPIFVFILIFTAFTFNPANAVHDYARHVLIDFTQLGPVRIALTTGGILFGLSLTLKMTVMMFSSSLLTFTSSIEELFYGLERIGLPYQFGLMTAIAVRFIPILRREAETIQQAQRARGAHLGAGRGLTQKVAGVAPVFVPMIASGMRRSETMAMALVSRGYGYTKQRTQIVDGTPRPVDLVVIGVIVAVVVGVVYLRVAFGIGDL